MTVYLLVVVTYGNEGREVIGVYKDELTAHKEALKQCNKNAVDSFIVKAMTIIE